MNKIDKEVEGLRAALQERYGVLVHRDFKEMEIHFIRKDRLLYKVKFGQIQYLVNLWDHLCASTAEEAEVSNWTVQGLEVLKTALKKLEGGGRSDVVPLQKWGKDVWREKVRKDN